MTPINFPGKRSMIAMVATLAVLVIGSAPSEAQVDPDIQVAQDSYTLGASKADNAKTDLDLLESLDAFDQAIALSPDWPDPYYSRAIVQTRLGRYTEAADSYRSYLRLRPDAPDAAAVQAKISEAERKADEGLNRDTILEMATLEGGAGAWTMEVNGQPAPFEYHGVSRNGNRIQGYVGKTTRGYSLNFFADIPEAGTKQLVYMYIIKGFVDVPPCPCDKLFYLKIDFISKNEMLVTEQNYSNNLQFPFTQTQIFRYRRKNPLP